MLVLRILVHVFVKILSIFLLSSCSYPLITFCFLHHLCHVLLLVAHCRCIQNTGRRIGTKLFFHDSSETLHSQFQVSVQADY